MATLRDPLIFDAIKRYFAEKLAANKELVEA